MSFALPTFFEVTASDKRIFSIVKLMGGPSRSSVEGGGLLGDYIRRAINAHPEVPRSCRFPDLDCLISQKVFIKLPCKCPFPHKSVNLFFMLVMIKDTLTVLCGN